MPMIIDFQTEPSRYRHWRVEFDGPVASLILDVDPAGGFFPGTELKLNSYDLGVDIELADAVTRLRFEHPEVRAVVRSEEHTSELQSLRHLVCRLLLEKQNLDTVAQKQSR